MTSPEPISEDVTPGQRRAVAFSTATLMLLAPLVASAACRSEGDSPAPSGALGGRTVPPPQVEPTAAPAHDARLDPMPKALWVQPGHPARAVADALRDKHPDDAALLDRLADTPAAVWLGGWTKEPKKTAAAIVGAARKEGALPVLVAYNIPDRDCGQHSAGGTKDVEAYDAWIGQIAAGIGTGEALVILEPDALTVTDCLTDNGLDERLGMLSRAVATLGKNPRTRVYLDGGHPKALPVEAMAAMLTSAGVGEARGFALNVSNFVSTKDNVAYGEKLSRMLGGSHYVIDTSRNGRGGTGEWCNPFGRGLGEEPTTAPGLPHGDAFLWVKRPGESDGTCHGGPEAGNFWPGYALELARASWQPKLSPVADAD